jgi:hypothetical protein
MGFISVFLGATDYSTVLRFRVGWLLLFLPLLHLDFTMANSGSNFDVESFRRNAFSYFFDNGRVTAMEYFSILFDIIDDLYGVAVSTCMRQLFLRVDDSVLQIVGFIVRLCQSFDLGVPSGIELFRWVGVDFTYVDWVVSKNPKWPGEKVEFEF